MHIVGPSESLHFLQRDEAHFFRTPSIKVFSLMYLQLHNIPPTLHSNWHTAMRVPLCGDRNRYNGITSPSSLVIVSIPSSLHAPCPYHPQPVLVRPLCAWRLRKREQIPHSLRMVTFVQLPRGHSRLPSASVPSAKPTSHILRRF